ncbi:MAG: hypothetical protein QM740_17975 [Acidovorax sp.]
MQPTEPAALLEAALEQYNRRCTQAKNALDSERWVAAAFHLRTAATMAQEWADRARALADWCDAQAESGRTHSAVPATLEPAAHITTLEPLGLPTLEALEAGLMSLAHAMGRDHAVRTRRAMNGVLQAQTAFAGDAKCA